MRALRIPYPPPTAVSRFADVHGLQSPERTIDFPDRRVSYVISCPEDEFARWALEVRRVVSRHEPGQEPPRLELDFHDFD